MSKYYVHKTEWHDDILEHNEYVKDNLFANDERKSLSNFIELHDETYRRS